MTKTSQPVHVATPDLQLGDIVLFYGMRILLDTEPKTWSAGHGETVYSWTGTIQNLDEVKAGATVPNALLYNTVRDPGTGDLRDEIDGRWTIQGNGLATWFVER